MFWDPDPQLFQIPFLNIPVYWYSLCFGLGFLSAYYLVLQDVRQRHPEEAQRYTDRLALFMFGGVLLGARLGHVFFYDWAYFSSHPEEIFSIPMRGLASHGAVVGILLSLLLFWTTTTRLLSLRALLDSVARAGIIAGAFIRIGNFMNQEIIGTPSSLPWAVTFGHPMEHAIGPHHPAQLYEALFYGLIFAILYWLKGRVQDGIVIGIALTSVFTFRFCIEFIKLSQGGTEFFGLHMGQLLSIPVIFLGLYFLKSSQHPHSQ